MCARPRALAARGQGSPGRQAKGRACQHISHEKRLGEGGRGLKRGGFEGKAERRGEKKGEGKGGVATVTGKGKGGGEGAEGGEQFLKRLRLSLHIPYNERTIRANSPIPTGARLLQEQRN